MLEAALSPGAGVGTGGPGRRGRCLELPKRICLPATLKIAAALLHTTLKYTRCVCGRVCVLKNRPPRLLFVSTSYRLVIVYDDLFVLCVGLRSAGTAEDGGTPAFGQRHADSARLPECPAVAVGAIGRLRPLRV